MQKAILVISLCLSTGLAARVQKEDLTPLWEAWKYKHAKVYSEVEEAIRFAIFSDNHHKVLKWNAEHDEPKLGINKFADLTGTEFKQKYIGKTFIEDPEFVKDHTLEQEDIGVLPSSVDWRNKGAVTPVKDEGQCGSTWAVASVDAIESLNFIYGNKLEVFSSQQIVDCDTQDFGCNGGYPNLAMEYVINNGIELEKDYPYVGTNNQCKYDASKAHHVISNYSFVAPKSVNAFKTQLVKQPVVAAIEADNDVFQLYQSGVIKAGCGAQVDHVVTVVGYDKIGVVEAFISKNQWGSNWGEDGYVYIADIGAVNKGLGVCGILSQPVVPLK